MIGEAVPLWLKLAFTVLVAVLIPVYWRKAEAGPRNFLWFSDIALFGATVALWLESALLASMMALAVALPELLWTVSVLSGAVIRQPIRSVGDYMFDPKEAWYVRALSLFHIPLLIVLIWLVWRLGYDSRALPAQTAVALVVFPLTYLVTEPRHNINRVFGPGSNPQRRLHPIVYLALVMAFAVLVVYLPTHLLLRAAFGR